MEERISQCPDLGFEEQPPESIKVAVTTLAFKNAEIINMLRERGAAIKAEKWDEQRKIEQKINDLKNEKFDELITPCSVFMTFEDEEGVNRALNYNESIKEDTDLGEKIGKWLGKYEIEIQPASEPSDIIWENRQFTPAQRSKKACVVYTIISVALFISFMIIFVLSNVSAAALNKYPIPSDCTSLIGYGDDLKMQQGAILEYRTNTALEEDGLDVSYSKYYV